MRLSKTPGGKKPTGKRLAAGTLDVEFPEEPTPGISSLGEAKIALHGETKIGKTLLSLAFPNSYLLMCEPGGSGVTARKKAVTSWEQFKGIEENLRSVPISKCGTVIVDTADFCYDLAFKWGCEKHGVEHPTEKGYGRVWDEIKGEFKTVIDSLCKQGRGVIFISHTKSAEFQERFGGSYNKLVPSMGNAARDYIGAIVDLTAYMGYYDKKRFITIEGSENLDAGHRLEDYFWVKGKKGSVRVHSIPMGNNAQTAYTNFVKAFNNLQLTSGEPAVNARLTEVKKPFAGKK